MSYQFAAAIFDAALPPAALPQAIEFSDMIIDNVIYYNRFVPFNVIGRVVDLNRSGEEVLLQNDWSDSNWYPVDKFMNVDLCRLTRAVQGVEVMAQ